MQGLTCLQTCLVTLVAITETRGRMCDDKVEWKRGKCLLPSLPQRGLSLLINRF